MKRKIVLAAAILVLLAGAWVVISRIGVEPEWKAAVELPETEADSPWKLQAEFGGLETVSGEGLAWDSLMLRMDCAEGGLLSFYGYPVLVDYWWFGKWYTVCESEQYYYVASSYYDTGGPKEQALRFPDGLFGRAGMYRVRLTVQGWKTKEVREVGQCTFWVGEPTGKVEDAQVNDFYRWDKCSGEDSIDKSLTLTPKRTYIDDEGVARLEFGLVCDSDYYYYGPDYMRVDMLWQGDWYTVSARDTFRAYAAGGECVPGQEYIHSAEIPRQVLRHPGTYRLYWGDVAYCEFTVK